MITKIRNREKRSLWKRLFRVSLIAIVIIAVIIYLTFSILNIKQKRTEIDQELKALESQIQDLERKNQELKAGISEKTSGGNGIYIKGNNNTLGNIENDSIIGSSGHPGYDVYGIYINGENNKVGDIKNNIKIRS